MCIWVHSLSIILVAWFQKCNVGSSFLILSSNTVEVLMFVCVFLNNLFELCILAKLLKFSNVVMVLEGVVILIITMQQ
jgi:hypothetical protein